VKPVTLTGSKLISDKLKGIHLTKLGTLEPRMQAPLCQTDTASFPMGAANNFSANLQNLVTAHGGSVNGAATAWKVPTKTLESVLKGQRIPTLDTAERLANAAGYPLWQLISSDFDPSNPPVLRSITAKEAALYERLKALAKELPNGN
jgi:transcriptional regulator with XRE-family HTH domain